MSYFTETMLMHPVIGIICRLQEWKENNSIREDWGQQCYEHAGLVAVRWDAKIQEWVNA